MNPQAGVLKEVAERGIFQTPRYVNDTPLNGHTALEGEVCIEGHLVTIQLVLDPMFPSKLPQFFLKPWDALGFIPHVDLRGFVCFADHEGMILDRRHPVQIVEEAFCRVVNILGDGVSGRNKIDFVDEFESYWHQIPGGMSAISFIDPSEEVCRIAVAINQNKGIHYVAKTETDISAFFNGSNIGGKFTIENGLYVPLKNKTVIIPPRPDEPFWNEEKIRQILFENVSPANKLLLEKFTKRRKRIGKNVIVSLPRNPEGHSLLGLHFKRIHGVHPLVKNGIADEIIPIQLHRWDKNYLIRRGGGEKALTSKRILIIGCGAIGGHAAFEFARAGILDMTLVDPDNLKAENTFRHVLGRQHWGQPKAKALKTEIENQLPYVSVKTIIDSIQNLVSNGIVNFNQFDLVFIAIGDPTVELEINGWIHTANTKTPTVFTWLEPLGIGGHALLTANTSGSGGCFECLFTSPSASESGLENRAAFAAPGQYFGRSITGCASLHTPYGSMDAVRTANLAVRLAIDALMSGEKDNPLLSWKGDATIFLEEGFRLSNRFNYSETDLFEHRYQYKISNCQVCGENGQTPCC